MLMTLIVAVLTSLAHAPVGHPSYRLNINCDPNQTQLVNVGHQKSSATIFCTIVFEGGGGRGPMPVTITVSGKDSALALKQILERLAEKPAGTKP